MGFASMMLPAAHPVLDPRTLGRPIHLLEGFAEKFGADLADFLHLGWDRRYGTQFVVASARITDSAPVIAARWNVYSCAMGRIGVALDRCLVLRLLYCRYGQRDRKDVDPASVPMTSTEERLARKLGLQLAQLLSLRIRQGLNALASDVGESACDEFSWRTESTDALGDWTLQLRIDEPQTGQCLPLQFSLDAAWMGLLLDQLAAGRTGPRKELHKDATQRLAKRLQVKLVARLLQRRMALGDVLDLRPGDIIPVSFQRADVLVKDARLFTAAVAAHKGGLWLTAFDDTL